MKISFNALKKFVIHSLITPLFDSQNLTGYVWVIKTDQVTASTITTKNSADITDAKIRSALSDMFEKLVVLQIS